MISYNFDLFSDTKDYFNNAMISISLLENLISKFQSCSLPKTVSSSTISGIVSNCNSIKDNAGNLQSTFSDISSAIDETENIQKEYAQVLGDIESLEGQQKNFDISSLVGGWTVDSELTEDIKTQLEEKYALKKELEEKLGVKVDDRKWYEALWDSIVEHNEDWENVCELQKNAKNETGADTSSKEAYQAAVMQHLTRGTSNGTVVGSNIFRSIGNVGEKILDFATQALGWLTATAYKNPQSHMSPYMMYAQENNLPFSQPEEIQAATKTIVTKNVVDDWYNSFYRDNVVGKNINAEAYTKYDDPFSVGLNKGVQGVVETGVVIAASVIGTPATGAAVAAGFETAVKGGEAVTRAYDNGATFDEATGYMAAEGGIYGLTTYLGSTYFSNMLSKGGTFIPTQTIDDALKVTFRYNPALKRVVLGTLVPASIPVVDSVSEWATWNSEETLKDIWNKNNTTEKTIFAGLTGFGLTTANEIAGSLLQGKYYKERFLDTYSKYGLTPEKIDEISGKITYLNGSDFEEFYKTTSNYDANFPDMYKYVGGSTNYKTGKITMNLDWKSPTEFDDLIGAVYHESNHRVGKISGWIKGEWTRGYNETFTDIISNRMSGKFSPGYSPVATKLMERLETIIDPSNTIIVKSYAADSLDPFIEALTSAVGDEAKAVELVVKISDTLNMATNITNPIGMKLAEGDLAKIVDMIEAMKTP